jgi:predicted MPP superfamily phosphohydrolase
MQGQILGIVSVCVAILLADWYITKGLKVILKNWRWRNKFIMFYCVFSIVLVVALLLSVYVKMGVGIRAGILFVFFVLFIGKICYLPFLLADDVRRLYLKIGSRFKKPETQVKEAPAKPDAIPRSEFLLKAGLLAAVAPFGALTYGITTGVYDYHIKRKVLYLPNLPKAFDGLKLGQVSDIHSGSFYNKKAVTGGVDMLMREKADLIFFTGDLVNDRATEMRDYQDLFSRIKAPLGVFSILGNHDYGDYSWPENSVAKRKNHDDLIATHKNMGWDLIRNGNRRLKVNGEEIGILGSENWGALSRFPKYGRMEDVVKNTDDLPVKLLLSHDPSHWRAEILPKYPQIDMMFSGHTHGMQFGVQTERFQWSPIEYVYKEWAGFYHENNQQLYVNVGYGFLGLSGRVGILPEITIFELKAGTDPLLMKA